MSTPASSTPPLRVLYLINSLGTGGSERSLAEMLPTMKREGVDIRILCLEHRAEGIESAVVGRLAEVDFLTREEARSRVTRVATVRRHLERLMPDIVHTTHFRSDLTGRIASAGLPLRVLTSLVNTLYDPVREKDPGVTSAKLAVIRNADALTANLFNSHFHAISESVKDDAVRGLRLPRDRVTVINRGRDPDRLGEPSSERRRRARRQLGLDEDDTVVVSVGRHEYQKGHATLVQGFAEVARRRPNLRLLIAGREGNATDRLKTAVELSGVAARIRLLGHRSDVPEILAAGDLFALMSRYEGLPGVLIEACALGLPAIATNVGAIREIVDDGRNADLVPVDDAPALAEAMNRMLDQPDRMQRYGRESRAIYLRKFTLQRAALRMVQLYRDLADTPARRIVRPVTFE